MFIAVDEYLKRISYALEHVAAPQIESDHARGQVLAAVFLLDQLTDKVEYKAGLIRQEIEMSCETMRKIVGACEEKAGNAPFELKSFIEEHGRDSCVKDLEYRNQCNKMLCLAIDFFYGNRDQLDPEAAHEINGIILGQFKKTGTRDLGMLKLSTSGKLIQTKD